MALSLLQRLKPAHMRLICAIADTGKLQLAAEQVAMSQPAASRLLSDIEAQTEIRLFNRLPSGMQPTAMGHAFLRHARIILAEVDALSDNIVKLRSGQAGTVRVGSVTGPAVAALVPALAVLRETAPDLQPTIEVAPSVNLIRGLEEGRFDFVLARIGSDNDMRAFQAYPGRTEQICLLADGSHPLIGRTVSLSDTLPFEHVIQEPGSPIRTAVERSFLEHGLTMPDRITNSSSLLIALSILAGSTAIAPQTHEVGQLLARTGSGLGIIAIHEQIVVSPFLVLALRDRPLSPVAQRLLDEVLHRL